MITKFVTSAIKIPVGLTNENTETVKMDKQSMSQLYDGYKKLNSHIIV